MIIVCQHVRNGEDYGEAEVFRSKAEVREELSDDMVLPQYKRDLFAWLDSDPDGPLMLDLSLEGSGVSSVDRWELHTG